MFEYGLKDYIESLIYKLKFEIINKFYNMVLKLNHIYACTFRVWHLSGLCPHFTPSIY